jgi:hypothetical protein
MYYFVIEHLRNIQGTFETYSVNILVHSFVSYLGTAVGRVYGGHHREDQNESSDRLQQESLQFAPKQDQNRTKTGPESVEHQCEISGNQCKISVQYGRLSSNEHVVFSHSVYGVGNQ